MVATIAAGTSAAYYLAQSEYYLGGSEPSGTWIAVGDGLGIVEGSVVEREAFERLHEAIGPDGLTLLSNGGKRIDRVPGYDVAFSAPKSVSVLWALGSEDLRNEIEAAQANAVEVAIGLIERNAAVSRRGKGGTRSEAVQLSVAAFQHGEARPTEHSNGRVFADPQLHTHAVILNLARRADGTVGTLDGRRLFAWKMAAGAAYHLELASGLQKLGLQITQIGRNGVFEIAGVDAGLSDYFSARRGEIETELAASGLTSSAAPALAGAITKASRSVKVVASGADRFAFWRDVARELGHEAVRVVESARAAGEWHASAKDTTPPVRAIEKRLDLVPDQLTQTESVFERRQLVAAVAAALLGSGASMERAEIEFARLIETRQVVELGTDAIGEKRYSTSAIIRIEREVFALTQTLATRQMPEPNRSEIDHLVERHRLSDEQAHAVSVATSGSAVAVIEGAAGSGKTTTLRPIVAAYRMAGYRIIGTATAWRIAHQLRDDLEIEARATDAWLAGRSAGNSFLDNKTLLVVDEAGQLSSRQMHAVLSEVARAGAKIVLVGDRRQLQPIGAGGALTIVARAAAVAPVDKIVRQRAEWQREAVMALADGRIKDAITAYAERGHVHLRAGPKATVAALVDVWEQAGSADPKGRPVLLARTKALVHEINAEVRKRLRVNSVLLGPEIVIEATSSSGQTNRLGLAVGDEIRFLTRNDRLHIINGTTATITAIGYMDEREPRITVRLEERDVSFLPSELADVNGQARLGHAYASTIYGAQGLTAEAALVLLDPACDRHDAYVALSRARARTEIFADRRQIDAGLRAERPLAERAALDGPSDGVRTDWLAGRMSRSGIKGTTLDCLPSQVEGDRIHRRSHGRMLHLTAESAGAERAE